MKHATKLNQTKQLSGRKRQPARRHRRDKARDNAQRVRNECSEFPEQSFNCSTWPALSARRGWTERPELGRRARALTSRKVNRSKLRSRVAVPHQDRQSGQRESARNPTGAARRLFIQHISRSGVKCWHRPRIHEQKSS